MRPITKTLIALPSRDRNLERQCIFILKKIIMKNQIEQLVKIAKDYAEVGKSAGLNQNHNIIQSYNSYEKGVLQYGNFEVKLYFADNYSTVSLYIKSAGFRETQISLYSNSITFDFDHVSEDYLQKQIDELILVLYKWKLKVDNDKLSEVEEKKQKQIEMLEEQIAILKSPYSNPITDIDLPF